MKIQTTEWEKIFAKKVTNKGLISKIYKQLMQLIPKKQANQKRGRRSKETFLWRRHRSKKKKQKKKNTWKDAQHHPLLEKFKSKQWGTTSHLSELPPSKRLQTINAVEGVEKKEPSYIVGGNVNWYNHYGKRYRVSSKNWKQDYHMIKQSHSWKPIQRNHNSKRHMHPNVHRNTVYNSQDTEAI